MVLMFGVFFVDSLGFLRIVETPTFVQSAWQSPDFGDHLFLGAVHVLGALVGASSTPTSTATGCFCGCSACSR
ncbi:hypothetical protein [Halorussus caseinilyticus]|uniref:Uncharacterized protein n=1 Tax=Halorussus caseinilyticus TaxID=3034025 RepID=A0ABD5WR92_9EURY